jgi:hypothetical protein
LSELTGQRVTVISSQGGSTVLVIIYCKRRKNPGVLLKKKKGILIHKKYDTNENTRTHVTPQKKT